MIGFKQIEFFDHTGEAERGLAVDASSVWR